MFTKVLQCEYTERYLEVKVTQEILSQNEFLHRVFFRRHDRAVHDCVYNLPAEHNMDTGVCTNKILKAERQHSSDKPWMEAVQLTLVGSALPVSHLQSSTRKNWSFANKSKTTITYTSKVLCTDVQELWRKPAYPADVILVIFSFKTDGLLSKPIFRYILIISIPSVQFNYWFTSLLSKISISIYLITVCSEECK